MRNRRENPISNLISYFTFDELEEIIIDFFIIIVIESLIFLDSPYIVTILQNIIRTVQTVLIMISITRIKMYSYSQETMIFRRSL